MRPMLSVDRPNDADYADFVDSEPNPVAFVRLLGRQAARCSVVEGDSLNNER